MNGRCVRAAREGDRSIPPPGTPHQLGLREAAPPIPEKVTQQIGEQRTRFTVAGSRLHSITRALNVNFPGERRKAYDKYLIHHLIVHEVVSVV